MDAILAPSSAITEEFRDPFGNLTVILPDTDFKVVEAFGRLIYCGRSDPLSRAEREQVLALIRPAYARWGRRFEFGGLFLD